MKVPCIKINNKDWNYIKPILEGFGYETDLVDMTIESPLDYLIIDCNGKLLITLSVASVYLNCTDKSIDVAAAVVTVAVTEI